MSYLNYPRIHFSGTYQANPSTINNTPNNWDPLFYPSANELEKVELYWNPRGDGAFGLMDDCVVTQVDYEDGTSATDPSQDSIIGQSVKCVYKLSFPLQSALVDLDPMQQNVSEIWAMTLQIGNAESNLTGKVPNVPFSGIWGQCQGPTAPPSSVRGAAVFQVKMNNVSQTGDSSSSRFLDYYKQNPSTFLSLNINTNAHNNIPTEYAFNASTFDEMRKAGVPDDVLTKMNPMQDLFQNFEKDGVTPKDKGNVPTEIFVKYMLNQYLSLDEFNANIDIILPKTKVTYPYKGLYDFTYGMITGTVGPSNENEATYFVPTRMMLPQDKSPAFYAPFAISDSGLLTLNLGNSLPTFNPGNDIDHATLGTIGLVAFPNGNIDASKALYLTDIDISSKDFLGRSAGFFSYKLHGGYNAMPLGIISKKTNTILLAEDESGLYMRANQFVYRMNPGYPSTEDFPRGKTSNVEIHVTKFGVPVSESVEISLKMMTEAEAITYTEGTQGTGGTKGIKNLSVPQEGVLTFPSTAMTDGNGVATFEMSCEDPNNPRDYVDGQVYFLTYNFTNNPNFVKSKNELVSVMIYDQKVEEDGPKVLAKFGRLYKVMGFLADEEKIEQIDMRNMIKTLLEKPMTELVHMPVTRDLSKAARDKVVAWVDAVNNS